jgi:hypothetical protein
MAILGMGVSGMGVSGAVISTVRAGESWILKIRAVYNDG